MTEEGEAENSLYRFIDSFMSRAALLFLLIASAFYGDNAQTTTASAAATLPPVPGGKLIDVTKPGYFNEPSIAANPANPQQLVAAYQVHTSVVWSQDGGNTWKKAEGTASRDYKVSGDVSITYDAKGSALVAYLAFDKLGTRDYWAHNATRNGLFVRRSLDGGKTWEAQERPVLAHITEPGIPFEDKPYIFADLTHGPHAGNIYIGWTEFTLTKTLVLFSRSTDGGATWSKPTEISTHEGLPRDDNGAVEGFTGTVGPDGTVYAAWADGDNIAFASSRDGGETFAASHNIVATAPLYFPVAGIERCNGFPQIAIDPRGSGVLYLTWSDYHNGDVNVFASTSADRGESWSAAVRVNSNPLHDGTDQFMQWLAVDPLSGAANVIFYDRRDDPQNKATTVTLARSTDGGKSFANYAWTNSGFEGKDDFIGDYIGIAAYGGRVWGVWAEKPAKEKHKHHTVVRVGLGDFNSLQGK